MTCHSNEFKPSPPLDPHQGEFFMDNKKEKSMKRTIRFIQDIEVDTDTKKCQLLAGYVIDGAQDYTAETNLEHMKNASAVLNNHGLKLEDLLKIQLKGLN
jgi:hypothetical protein